MAILSLQLNRDDHDGIFLCGSEISGTVNLQVAEQCPKTLLFLALQYIGEGEAPQQHLKNNGEISRISLSSGPWQPGSYQYPFRLLIPDICAYDGKLMKLRWVLVAGLGAGEQVTVREKGDVRGFSQHDVTETLPIEPAPGPVKPEDRKRRLDNVVHREETGAASKGCLLQSALLTVAGMTAAWLGMSRDLHLPGLFVTLIGAILFGYAVWRALIHRRIARIAVDLDSSVIWPGEAVICRVTLQGKTPLTILSAELTLTGEEHVKKETGMHRTTGPRHVHVFHRSEHALEVPRYVVLAGQPITLKGEVQLPPDAPCSMDFDNELQIQWRLEVALQIQGTPRWFDTQTIKVLPRMPGDGKQ